MAAISKVICLILETFRHRIVTLVSTHIIYGHYNSDNAWPRAPHTCLHSWAACCKQHKQNGRYLTISQKLRVVALSLPTLYVGFLGRIFQNKYYHIIYGNIFSEIYAPENLHIMSVQGVNHSDVDGDHFTKWQPFVQKLSDIDACLYVFTVNIKFK